MKLLTFFYQDREHVGMLEADGTHITVFEAESMTALIERCGTPENVRRFPTVHALRPTLAEVRLAAPIPRPRQDIICLGVNYAAHKEEAVRFAKENFTRDQLAIYFSKRVNRAVAPNEPIPAHADIVEGLDYECELAVIIGRDACRVSAADALSYVFGYTIVNDMSARNLQTGHKQWYFGKSLDGFTPMGPWIVTSDELDCPSQLDIRCRINGELRQNSNTSLLLTDIPAIIAELSSGMTLLSGTIIATGTPAGVGMGFQPPRFLSPGDKIACEIEKIGLLENTIATV